MSFVNDLFDRFGAVFTPHTSVDLGAHRELHSVESRYTGYIIDRTSVDGVPSRPIAHVNVTETESFIAYLQAHGKTPAIFYTTIPKPILLGICDYHHADGAAWGEHRVVLEYRESLEYREWVRAVTDWQRQHDVVQLLDNYADIVVEPDAATVQETIRTLTATLKSDYADVRDDFTGAINLTMSEAPKIIGKNNVDVPRTISVKFPVFEGGDQVTIPIRLRYRIEQGAGLRILLDGKRAFQRAVDLAIDASVVTVREQLPDVPMYRGALTDMYAPTPDVTPLADAA